MAFFSFAIFIKAISTHTSIPSNVWIFKIPDNQSRTNSKVVKNIISNWIFIISCQNSQQQSKLLQFGKLIAGNLKLCDLYFSWFFVPYFIECLDERLCNLCKIIAVLFYSSFIAFILFPWLWCKVIQAPILVCDWENYTLACCTVWDATAAVALLPVGL